jgi:hypothetical protein
LVLFCFLCAFAAAQSDTGELRLQVQDPAGLSLEGSVELVSNVSQVHESGHTDTLGRFVRHNLPFGTYVVHVSHPGFATYSKTVQIASRVPFQLKITLPIESPNSEVLVRDSQTLVDPQGTGSVARVGRRILDVRQASPPGRSVINIVASQPGWVLESNGTLHPRGSENQVQYIVDGIPLTENRSPAYSSGVDAEDVESMALLTGNYPAEYGRKLGGVIELNSRSDIARGFHGEFSGTEGSFASAGGYGALGYGGRNTSISVSGHGDASGRYLDPPVLENFTNHGRTNGEQVRYQRELSAADRLTLSAMREEVSFEVPNELLQEAAAQRQTRGTRETFGTATYEHVISNNALADVRVMFRDLSADLMSNQSATPVIARQQREFREAYLKSTVSVQRGMHDLKAGIEIDYSPLRERFGYEITDRSFFDPSTPPKFTFSGRGIDRDEAAFIQDALHLGHWSASLGLRYDHYSLLVHRGALSPRLGIAWY